MTSPIVPPAPDPELTHSTDPPESRPSRRRRWWIIGGVGAVLIGMVVAAFVVQLPYYLVQPGSVRPAEQRIDVEGAEAYETDGEVMFTTVYLSRATPALMVRAWLDDAVEVRTEQEMYPDGDRDGARRENRARMDLSKQIATLVALNRAGIPAEMTAQGARVLGVVEDSGSDGVLEVDDVIVGVDGAEVSMPADIGAELEDRAPGDTVEVEVERGDGDEDEDVQVVLGAAEDDPSRPVLGVSVEPADPTISSDVEISVDSGDVSGPSAGLAWTLAIIDRLTPGSLTDGERVAVTGEILADGSVGPIGALPQKVATVKRAGIDLFLFPASTPEADQAAARRIAGDDVELAPVDSIDEALDVLAPDGLQMPA